MINQREKKAAIYELMYYNISSIVFFVITAIIFALFTYFFLLSDVFEQFHFVIGILAILIVSYSFTQMFLYYSKHRISAMKVKFQADFLTCYISYKWRYYVFNIISLILIVLFLAFTALRNNYATISFKSIFLIFMPALFVPAMAFVVLKEKQFVIKNKKLVEYVIKSIFLIFIILMVITFDILSIFFHSFIYQGPGIRYITYLMCIALSLIIILQTIIMEKPNRKNITQLYKILAPAYFMQVALIQYLKELNSIVFFHLTVDDIFKTLQFLIAVLALLLLIKTIVDWIKLKKFSFDLLMQCFFCVIVVGSEISTLVVMGKNLNNSQVHIWNFPGLMSSASFYTLLGYCIIFALKKRFNRMDRKRAVS